MRCTISQTSGLIPSSYNDLLRQLATTPQLIGTNLHIMEWFNGAGDVKFTYDDDMIWLGNPNYNTKKFNKNCFFVIFPSSSPDIFFCISLTKFD